REKTAGNSEHGDNDRVQSNGEKKRDDRNQGHQQKCRNRSEEREVIIRSTCKSHRVEDEHARGAESLRGDGVFLSLQQYSADKQRDADDEANRNAQFRRNEIVLEGIFHKKRHAEEKREPADPREKFRAHELLPIDWRSWWFWRRRRRFRLDNLRRSWRLGFFLSLRLDRRWSWQWRRHRNFWRRRRRGVSR